RHTRSTRDWSSDVCSSDLYVATRAMTKTERWLNLIAFLLNHHYPVTREELLSQVADYNDDWNTGDERRRESVRRKFERDKSELQIGRASCREREEDTEMDV